MKALPAQHIINLHLKVKNYVNLQVTGQALNLNIIWRIYKYNDNSIPTTYLCMDLLTKN